MDRKMQVIAELMEELQGMMEYDESDLSSRLGREKPSVDVVKIEGEIPGESMDDMDSMEGEDPEAMDGLEPESPEEKLKSRLMKLRA